MAALRNRLGSDSHHMAKPMREHAAIAEAVAHRDLAEANRILVGHIARKEGSYWEHLDPSGSALLGPAQAEGVSRRLEAFEWPDGPPLALGKALPGR